MKNNVMVVCGNSIEDLENGVKALKNALAGGACCGIGGSSIEEIEQGLKIARSYFEEEEEIEEEEAEEEEIETDEYDFLQIFNEMNRLRMGY